MGTQATPSPFSTINPKLQIAWDATSLRSLMTCPRQYQLGIIEGHRIEGGNVDTDFGGFFASATEDYKKERLNGRTKQQATITTIRRTLERTYDPILGPWGGSYETRWRCTGVAPYRNARGNRAKCRHSHAGVWYPEPAPETCGECGSPVETVRGWVPHDRTKNRHSLLRLVAWYCDEQPEEISDGPFPYQFPNGQPAVELSFRMPLPWKVQAYGHHPWPEDAKEQYMLVGHLDSIMVAGGEKFIDDNKTTKKTLNKAYFAQYAPNIQVETYDLAGATLFAHLDIRGVMIEGAQILQDGARFGNGIVYGSDALREEYLHDLRYWLDQAERFAREDYWPKNRAACYLCQFKTVCSKEPEARQAYLQDGFVRKPWNPLEER